MQLTHPDFALERWLMWRHATQSRRYIKLRTSPHSTCHSPPYPWLSRSIGPSGLRGPPSASTTNAARAFHRRDPHGGLVIAARRRPATNTVRDPSRTGLPKLGMLLAAAVVPKIVKYRQHPAVVLWYGMQTEFGEDAADVLFDGAVGNDELLGNP